MLQVLRHGAPLWLTALRRPSSPLLGSADRPWAIDPKRLTFGLQGLGDQERQLQRLTGVQPRVAVGVVAVAQTVFADGQYRVKNSIIFISTKTLYMLFDDCIYNMNLLDRKNQVD